MANPELPLGSAENFLLTLGSISEIAARLKLWVFKLDYDNMEKVCTYVPIYAGVTCQSSIPGDSSWPPGTCRQE